MCRAESVTARKFRRESSETVQDAHNDVNADFVQIRLASFCQQQVPRPGASDLFR
jgi:hypothetical protein